MMDQLSAQLMANLDISKLNQQLTAYIDKEIQNSRTSHLQDFIRKTFFKYKD
jgi:hypothetical protein